jgi:PTS system fructose-specific IIA component
MCLAGIITGDLIDLNLDAGTKQETIEKLTDLLLEDHRISSRDDFLASVFERERTEPTDMGIGVAIPHGKTDAVIKASVAIGKMRSPIPWTEEEEAQDEPIYAVFLMASPDQADGYTHLEVISKIASLLIDDDFIEILKTTRDENLLLETMQTMIGEY